MKTFTLIGKLFVINFAIFIRQQLPEIMFIRKDFEQFVTVTVLRVIQRIVTAFELRKIAFKLKCYQTFESTHFPYISSKFGLSSNQVLRQLQR
jgi:hypothetical protein